MESLSQKACAMTKHVGRSRGQNRRDQLSKEGFWSLQRSHSLIKIKGIHEADTLPWKEKSGLSAGVGFRRWGLVCRPHPSLRCGLLCTTRNRSGGDFSLGQTRGGRPQRAKSRKEERRGIRWRNISGDDPGWCSGLHGERSSRREKY